MLPVNAEWDLLFWDALGITDPSQGMWAQIGGLASSTRPEQVTTIREGDPSSWGVRIASRDGNLSDYQLFLSVPARFTVEFEGSFRPPTGAFASSSLALALGAQDRGGEGGLVYMDRSQDHLLVRAPPSLVSVPLDQTTYGCLSSGDPLTIRVVMDGDRNVQDVYVTRTSDLPTSGHVRRATLPALGAASAVDVLSFYLCGTGTAASEVFLRSVKMSSRLLYPDRRPTAVVPRDQVSPVGSPVVLNGLQSSDPAGKPLAAFTWRIRQQPAGSNVTLSGMSRASATLSGLRVEAKPSGCLGNGTGFSFGAAESKLRLEVLYQNGSPGVVVHPFSTYGGVSCRLRDVAMAINVPGHPAYSPQVAALISAQVTGDEWASAPTSGQVVLTGGKDSGLPIAEFTPTVQGFYEMGLTVTSFAGISSQEAVTSVRAEGQAMRLGSVPEAGYLWQYISNFWSRVKRTDIYETYWSALIQKMADECLRWMQLEDERSLQHFPNRSTRRWVPFVVREELPESVLTYRASRGYAVTPVGSPGQLLVGQFSLKESEGKFAVGDKLAWNGNVLTVTKCGPMNMDQEVPSPYVFDPPIMKAYEVIDSGSRTGRALDTEDYSAPVVDGLSAEFVLDDGLFTLPTLGSRLKLDSGLYPINVGASNAAKLVLDAPYLPACRAYLTTPQVRLVAKAAGSDGNRVGASCQLSERRLHPSMGTCSIHGEHVHLNGFGSVSDYGVQPGDQFVLFFGTPQRLVANVAEILGDRDLRLDRSLYDDNGPLWFYLFAPPSLRVPPNSTFVEILVRPTNTVGELLSMLHDPESPYYRPEVDGLVEAHALVGLSDEVEEFAFEQFSGGVETARQSWSIVEPVTATPVYRAAEIRFWAPPDVQADLGDLVEMNGSRGVCRRWPVLASSPSLWLLDSAGVTLQGVLQGEDPDEPFPDVPDEDDPGLQAAEDPSTLTAKHRLRTTTLQGRDGLVSVPRLQDIIKNPPTFFAEGVDHVVENGNVRLLTPPPAKLVDRTADFILADVRYGDTVKLSPGNIQGTVVGLPRKNELSFQVDYADGGTGVVQADLHRSYAVYRSGKLMASGTAYLAFRPDRLWAEVVFQDNDEALESNFGLVVGLPRTDFSEASLNIEYLSAIRGLHFVVFSGPTQSNIRIGSQIFCNLPFSEVDGTIIEILPNFDLVRDVGRIRIQSASNEDDVRTYYYSRGLGLETFPDTDRDLAEGDVVTKFQPLSKGVQVDDYLSDPDSLVISSELQKYHSFQVRVDSRALSASMPDLLVQFAQGAKPMHTDVLITAILETEDELGITDDVEFVGNMVFRDDRYTCEDVGPQDYWPPDGGTPYTQERPPFDSGYAHCSDDYDGSGNMVNGKNRPVTRSGRNVGPKGRVPSDIGVPKEIETALLAMWHSNVYPRSHICTRNGRQSTYCGRVSFYGPEDLADGRLCATFPEDYTPLRDGEPDYLSDLGLTPELQAYYTAEVLPRKAGSFAKSGTIFKAACLRRVPGSNRTPPASWEGPAEVLDFLANSVPDVEHGFYIWSGVRVRREDEGVLPYLDASPTGPGADAPVEPWLTEPWWRPNWDAPLLKSAIAGRIQSLDPPHPTAEWVSKYPAPMPLLVEPLT